MASASVSTQQECFDLPDAPDDIDLSFLDGLLDGTLDLPADEPLLQSTSQVFEEIQPSTQPSASAYTASAPASPAIHAHQIPTPASSNGSAPRSPSGCHAPSTGTSQQGSAHSAGTTHSVVQEDAAKKEARMQRNRESAHNSRQRKKMHAAELEQQNAQLTAQNKHLNGLVSQLATENMVLKQQLVAVCQATNTALPCVPGLVLTHTHLATPVHPIAYSVLPTPTTTPKIPLQRLDKPARPAPALKTTAGVGKRGRAGSGGTSKRSKTAAAAGTTMLAVFSLATLFMVGISPFSGSVSRGSSVPTEQYAALPGGVVDHTQVTVLGAPRGGPAGGAPAGGVALPSSSSFSPSPSSSSSSSSEAEAEAALSAAAVATAAAHSDGHGQQHEAATTAQGGGQHEAVTTAQAWMANASAWLVPEQQGELAGRTLQHLQDVSSTALVWQPHLAQQHPGLLQLLPQWESLPTLLGAPLTADGLLSPLTCDKVFEVDATSLPDHEKLQRRIDSYVASLEGFRGRAMPLPPVGGAQEEGGEGATGGVGGKGKRGRVLGGEGDVLVSVVLPIKQGEKGGSGGVLRALDRLFVVLLQQSAVYATYSCQLPKLGFM